MGSDGIYFTLIHDNNLIRMLYGRDSLRNDNFGCFRNLCQEGLLNERVRFRVDGAGGIIHNKYFWLFKQSAGDAEPLLLTAGNITSALFNICVVALREGLNKIIGLGEFAGMD